MQSSPRVGSKSTRTQTTRYRSANQGRLTTRLKRRILKPSSERRKRLTTTGAVRARIASCVSVVTCDCLRSACHHTLMPSAPLKTPVAKPPMAHTDCHCCEQILRTRRRMKRRKPRRRKSRRPQAAGARPSASSAGSTRLSSHPLARSRLWSSSLLRRRKTRRSPNSPRKRSMAASSACRALPQ